VYKILTTVINNRLKKYTEYIIGEYQAGFRTRKPITTLTFTVQIYWENSWEHNVEIHQNFVNFQKTYDSIRKDNL